jgi:hypothetical protein
MTTSHPKSGKEKAERLEKQTQNAKSVLSRLNSRTTQATDISEESHSVTCKHCVANATCTTMHTPGQ